ncbi:MAG TPA: molecular chaperone TorD family protein [Candidatus Binataceae bacterium]|nr:molecular chaperone TorD family protein [Candidatus Binataceae bacterium]
MDTCESVPEIGESDAAARSRLYQWLSASFAFPTEEFHETVLDGSFVETMRRFVFSLPYGSALSFDEPDWDRLSSAPPDYDDLSAEYIRLFDVGIGGGKPPCTLYGGEYPERPRLDVMEELVRFYGFFDLQLPEQDRELPDHITVELEFMHYLAYREALALERGNDPMSYRRAQADFIRRHLGAWVPVMGGKLVAEKPIPFFAALVDLTAQILRADLAYLTARA